MARAAVKASRSKVGKRSAMPARDRAYQHIRAQINARKLTPGQPLSELSLAGELGSSRTPIREAIGLLVAEGILETTHNRGAAVRKLTRSDIVDLCEVREALELFTSEKAANRGLVPEQANQLRATIEGVRQLVETLPNETAVLDEQRMAQFSNLDRRFHEQIVLLTMNRAVQDILRKARVLVQVFAMQRRGHDKAMLQRVVNEHEQVLHALERREAEAVRSLLRAHLQSSMRERLEEFDTWERQDALTQSFADSTSDEPLLLI